MKFYCYTGRCKDGKLGKGGAKNQISQKCAQDPLQIAPNLCYYDRIMIGGHWCYVEHFQVVCLIFPLQFFGEEKSQLCYA